MGPAYGFRLLAAAFVLGVSSMAKAQFVLSLRRERETFRARQV